MTEQLVARAELTRVLKAINGETELLEKIGEEKVVLVGKGTSTENLQATYKRIMLKLDEMKLIDETPEEAIDFWEENITIFGDEVVVEDPPEEKAPAKKAPAKKAPAAKKGETEKSIYGHKLGSQGAILDDLFQKGTTLEDAAEAIGAKVGRVKGHLNHLQNDKGLVFDVSKAGVYTVKG
jgi:hypothetical protein